MSFATNSLPVPDSPKICTGAWLRATRRNHFAQVLHGRRSAEQARTKHAGIASLVPDNLMAASHQFAQTRKIKWLGDEIKGAQFERAHRSLHIAVSGDHRDRYGRCVLLHPLDQLQAVAVGKLHIGQAQIELLGFEQALRRGHGVRCSRIPCPCAAR